MLAAAGVVVVLVLAWLAFVRGTPGQAGVVVREPVAFNLIYTDALHRVAPRGGRDAAPADERRARRSPSPCARCAWRPTRATSARPSRCCRRASSAQMGAQYPGFLWRGDGRVNINQQPGYQIVFQARIGGRTTYGKRVLLVAAPDPPPRDGPRHHDALRALARDPARRRGGGQRRAQDAVSLAALRHRAAVGA